MTCDDGDALMRDVVARVECVASESHPRHSVVDLRYLLSGSVMILVYPHPQAIANIANAARRLNGPHDRLEDYFTAYIFDPIRALEYPY